VPTPAHTWIPSSLMQCRPPRGVGEGDGPGGVGEALGVGPGVGVLTGGDDALRAGAGRVAVASDLGAPGGAAAGVLPGCWDRAG
jgi:hypothetical protein